jgi:hypothetical protein
LWNVNEREIEELESLLRQHAPPLEDADIEMILKESAPMDLSEDFQERAMAAMKAAQQKREERPTFTFEVIVAGQLINHSTRADIQTRHFVQEVLVASKNDAVPGQWELRDHEGNLITQNEVVYAVSGFGYPLYLNLRAGIGA